MHRSLALLFLLSCAPARAQEMHHHGAAPLPVAVTHQVQVPDGATGVALPELGIEIVAVRMSAANTMLDLRYRVLDPAKAKPLMSPAVPINLVDQSSGAVASVPVDEQVGALRQSGANIRPGQVLATLFANPGRVVQKGSKVTIRLGDVEIVGLKVEG